jgi:hypothetical protein
MAYAVPSPTTAYGKELARFEQHRTKYTAEDDGVPPGNPYQFREYPRMMYRAVQHPRTKQMVCMDIAPNPMLFSKPQEYDHACVATEQLNRQCTRIVPDDVAFRNALNEGWRSSPKEALEAHEQKMCAIAEETARRHFSDQAMSPRAQAEADRVDASTEHQVPDVQTELARAKARK